MAVAVKLTQEEFERIANDVVAKIVAESTIVMQRKLQASGYVMSGDLLNSIHQQSVVVGRELYAEFSIGFRGYGRFKDMRKLLYSKMPPIEAMEEFVRHVGVDKFGYVPGYLKDARRRVSLTDSRAINRIAWGIAINRMKMGVKMSRSANAFYNPTRGKLIYETSYKLLERLPEPILKTIKEQLESE